MKNSATPEDLFKCLADLDIDNVTIEHPPVFTAEEAAMHCSQLPGAHCKTLFLKDKKDILWLIIALDYRRLDMKKLQNILGSGRLSFGKPDLMEQILGVTPGSVTPFALINDHEKKIIPVLDTKILEEQFANFHPLTNTMTTTIKSSDLKAFMGYCGHMVHEVDLDEAS